MARFALRQLPKVGGPRRLLELGCGSGRDLEEFARRGFDVAAVDLSVPAVRIARRRSLLWKRPKAAARPIIDSGDAVEFLSTQPSGSADVVYSNLFLTMGTSESARRSLRRQIDRVLRPGGWHLYSVRTYADRWYGQGVELAKDVFDLSPAGPPVRFFDVARLRRRGFELLRATEATEGTGRTQRKVVYVAEQKREK